MLYYDVWTILYYTMLMEMLHVKRKADDVT